MRKVRGQAMTELVIVLPLFIMLLLGLHQFGVLMTRRIELAAVEREAMRYLCSEDDPENLEAFVKEYGGLYGMEAEKISITKQNKGSGAMGKSEFGGFFEKITGVVFVLSYEQALTPMFVALTGKSSVKLKTSLATATGGSMKVLIDKNSIKSAEDDGGV
ncbi:MAG: pilus assembly protein [Spirochaetia bacterium]|nr:pilus assembly protein [Spirochaetia bacterium]